MTYALTFIYLIIGLLIDAITHWFIQCLPFSDRPKYTWPDSILMILGWPYYLYRSLKDHLK